MRISAVIGGLESLDDALTTHFEGAPLLVAMGLAFLLGLRHASDPDHLVAVTSVGVVILFLAVRVLWKWKRGHYRASFHGHEAPQSRHRHLHDESSHIHVQVQGPKQAFSIGILHGLAGTGAIVVLLVAALPSRMEAAAAMAVFAPMSIVSMTAFTAAFAWLLTRPAVQPVYRMVLMPLLGSFGVLFGLWYVGLT